MVGALQERLRADAQNATRFADVRKILGPDLEQQPYPYLGLEDVAQCGTLWDADADQYDRSTASILEMLATRIPHIDEGRDQAFASVLTRAATIRGLDQELIRAAMARQLEHLSGDGIEAAYNEMFETARRGVIDERHDDGRLRGMTDHLYAHVLTGLARALPILPPGIQRAKAEELLAEINRVGGPESFRAEALEAFASSLPELHQDALDAIFDSTLDAVTPLLSRAPAACALPHLATAVSRLSDVDARIDRFARVFAAADDMPSALNPAGLLRGAGSPLGVESRIPDEVQSSELRARTLGNLMAAVATFPEGQNRVRIAQLVRAASTD